MTHTRGLQTKGNEINDEALLDVQNQNFFKSAILFSLSGSWGIFAFVEAGMQEIHQENNMKPFFSYLYFLVQPFLSPTNLKSWIFTSLVPTVSTFLKLDSATKNRRVQLSIYDSK